MAAGIAGAAVALSLPSAGLAIGLLDGGAEVAAPELSFASFTPASADPALARLIAARGDGSARMMRFTPAGVATSNDRSVTVAVRIDEESAQAISVHSAISSARESVAAASGTRIASTRYNLGLARGYRSFAQAPAVAASIAPTSPIPNLSDFKPSVGLDDGPSRFAARIELDESNRSSRAVPQALEPLGEQVVDVMGSYRLSRNVDVTAGLRYEQQRDRLSALPDIEQRDSQAVYIGTQFRF